MPSVRKTSHLFSATAEQNGKKKRRRPRPQSSAPPTEKERNVLPPLFPWGSLFRIPPKKTDDSRILYRKAILCHTLSCSIMTKIPRSLKNDFLLSSRHRAFHRNQCILTSHKRDPHLRHLPLRAEKAGLRMNCRQKSPPVFSHTRPFPLRQRLRPQYFSETGLLPDEA